MLFKRLVSVRTQLITVLSLYVLCRMDILLYILLLKMVMLK